MKFDDLDKRMRVYETTHDHCVLPGVHIVARLDGRSFTRLTKEVHQFDAPFDERFRDTMLDVTEHLMACGMSIDYGYTQSDEISLLFSASADDFARKTRKLSSVLAGEASAKFSLALGAMGCFDCRICELPRTEDVVDYFRWRNEDAHRNALSAHCYWAQRHEGISAAQATQELLGMSVAEKNEFLFQRGINFNEVPNWQKRGVGLYWQTYTKAALNPKTGQNVEAQRRRIHRDMNLPMRDEYSQFIRELIAGRATTD